jgi:uncharacterized protein YndB with AHSA1/START domain
VTTPEKNDVRLTVRKIFHAPREKVFAAWTDPHLLKQWWGSPGYTTPIAEIDLRVGGHWRLGMKPPDRDVVHICTGEFTEVKSPEKLVYTWRWEGGESASRTVVSVEFIDHGTDTELILIHSGFADEKDKGMHNEGWSDVLQNLEQLISSLSA